MRFIKNIFCIFFFANLICGCASFEKRIEFADEVAGKASMKKQEVVTSRFILTTYSKITDKSAPVNIYIEGDGYAYATRGRLSVNPTPKDAFTLVLAAQDPAPNIVYIARPCQYTSLEKDKACTPKYWAGSRFAPEVVDSVNDAISHYTKLFSVPKINLIGYSGGGAIAALISAKRNDVVSLRTVAGNLDHVMVNEFHNVDNLDNSLNAIDVAAKLANLPGRYFVGSKDEIIPLGVAESFIKKVGSSKDCAKIRVINDATHYLKWQEIWPSLLVEPMVCGRENN